MELVTPHLKSVLKNYQHSATKSLQGPAALGECGAGPLDEASDAGYVAPPPVPVPVHQVPILGAADTSVGARAETALEGEAISCFVVGGERRLCLPQVLNSVLREFSLQQINQECDRLQIYCSRCTPAQLAELKATGILPHGAPSCGLITKTDAERLCSALLHGSAPPYTTTTPVANTATTPTTTAFRVFHECFGKCAGVCRPERAPRCIECAECRGAFSPQQFVCHAHRHLENRTCHWGFDSANWRAYLHVARDQPDRDHCASLLDQLKDVHQEAAPALLPATPLHHNPHKRKQMSLAEADVVSVKGEPLEGAAVKKSKLDEYAAAAYLYAAGALDPLYLHAAMYEQWAGRPLPAFRPLLGAKARAPPPPPPPLKEPPPLQHPERVVPESESERFERSYQPNVALAPRPRPHVEPAAVVDSTGAEYNPEIELSTDTDDSLSDASSERGAGAEVQRVAAALADVGADTRDRVLAVVRQLARDHAAALQRIRDLEHRVRLLETAPTSPAPPATAEHAVSSSRADEAPPAESNTPPPATPPSTDTTTVIATVSSQ